ncbi:hypothetical protein KQX54_018399 [Cotesia glomerata]|uniref:Uncharacterized protein n=1 Tax=Cotesia glomerata TaxID=32391 RepID=A0AAV7J7Q9_COTGL|nr:hypothetical protein KQX54_018399 [Cotesia glomerata]
MIVNLSGFGECKMIMVARSSMSSAGGKSRCVTGLDFHADNDFGSFNIISVNRISHCNEFVLEMSLDCGIGRRA